MPLKRFVSQALRGWSRLSTCTYFDKGYLGEPGEGPRIKIYFKMSLACEILPPLCHAAPRVNVLHKYYCFK